MDQVYQTEHLQFVSNNNGTSPLEIMLVGGPVHCSLLLLTGLSQWLGLDYSSFLGTILESAIAVLPPLLSLTVLSRYAAHIALGLFLLSIGALALGQRHRKSKNNLSRLWELSVSAPRRAVFITNFRASMLLVTTICILAVDFPAFPRRFAKTENFGYGLMDLGVGSFVFSNGLVSPEARSIPCSLKKNIFSCVPLIVLGLFRLVSVSLIGYHENVAEYGVHWNFFFSLAAVRILSSLILHFVEVTKKIWVMSVVVAVLYEGVLTFWLGEWIVSDAPREDLISANREGLCSSIGYLSIYLAGVAWGREILPSRGSMSELMDVARLLLLWTFIMWLSLAYSTTFFLPPSRRMANYTFFTWIVAYNLTLLSLFLLLDMVVIFFGEVKLASSDSSRSSKISKVKSRHSNESANLRKLPKKPKDQSSEPSAEGIVCNVYRCPQIYKSIDYNGLVFFLLGNVGTGVVNMSVATLHADDITAVLLLSLYVAVLSFVALILFKFKIKLKFW